jgi:hypothetical protein
MLGVASSGYWFVRALFPDLGFLRQVVLSYSAGFALIGFVSHYLWQADVPFSFLYWATWGFMTVFALGTLKHLKLGKIMVRSDWKSWRNLLPKNFLLSAWVWVAIFSFCIVSAWLWFVRPVVWDALVLYDWRAMRIADGWLLSDFFQQFTQHPEFANYDFSHPFLSSIWQAFAHKSGLDYSGLIYYGLFLSIMVYAVIIFRQSLAFWIFLALLLGTTQMLTVFTQVYAALPYTLYWLLFFLVLVDESVWWSRRKPGLLLIFLIVTMLNRLTEPLWLLGSIMVIWTEVSLIKAWPSKSRFILWSLFPILMVYGQWAMLQSEASSWVQLPEIKEVSSYALNRYANFQTIMRTPVWWWQAGQLITFRNVGFPYVLLAVVLSVISHPWKRSEKLILVFVLGGMAVLFAGLILEISAMPELWHAKSRLLWRVTLPLTVGSIVLTAQLVKRRWSE